MSVSIKMRVQIDNREAAREAACLRRRAEQSERMRADLEHLFESGVSPFVLVPLPATRRNEARYRSELGDPYWQLLEREAV